MAHLAITIAIQQCRLLFFRLAGVELHDVMRFEELATKLNITTAQAGVSGFIVRDLLRHANISTTGRYANFDANPVR